MMNITINMPPTSAVSWGDLVAAAINDAKYLIWAAALGIAIGLLWHYLKKYFIKE